MNQVWIAALGKDLKRVINSFQYPSLDKEVITDQVVDEWRSILSGLSPKNEAARQMIHRRLLHGIVSEIEDKDQFLLFHVKFAHKGELYQAALKLENLQWAIHSLHYLGKADRSRLVWGGSIALALALLLGSWLVINQLADQKLSVLTKTGSVQATPATHTVYGNQDVVGLLAELKDEAADQGYYILTEEELNALVDERLQDSVIQHLADREGEEENQAGKKSSTTEDKEKPSSEKKEDDQEKMIKINIKPGMTSPDIASQLVETGLARSEKEVIQLFRELDVDRQLRSGTYEIPSTATYAEVISILIGR